MALQTFEMHKLSELWKLFPTGPRPAFPPCSATLLFYSFISNNRDFFLKKNAPQFDFADKECSLHGNLPSRRVMGQEKAAEPLFAEQLHCHLRDLIYIERHTSVTLRMFPKSQDAKKALFTKISNAIPAEKWV